MTTEKEQWCWREVNGEMAAGPFQSREEAIEEAKGSSDSRVVLIGHCVYPDPAHIAKQVIDVDFLLEQMEEYHYENEYPVDDQVFDLYSKEEHGRALNAQEALQVAVKGWATLYIKPPTYWHTSEQEEEVVIHPEVEA
jgi:tryptophan 2,3-dioxygenase